MAKTKVVTLRKAVDAYITHLEAQGKADPTIRSYKGDYELLVAHFGEKTAVGKIAAPRMGKFLKSNPVTKLRNGKPKAERSIEKSKRAIRHFLAWCVEEGYLAKSPFPGK